MAISQETAKALYEALEAATGYMLNAVIDLETGAPKKTAITTLEGGLKRVRATLMLAARETP